MILWIKRNYLIFVFLIFFGYVLLAFIAPVMMKLGFPVIGEKIYFLYSSVCHQYAHRSWFLFGRQAYYPLEVKPGIISVYDAFNISSEEINIMRTFIGDDLNGYKVAICQRDVALYGAISLFTLLYSVVHKKLRRIPFSLWLLLAIIPMGIDGTLQLLSGTEWLNFLNLSHESTPLLRTITGGMFGFFSAWFVLPAIEESYKEA